jgi:hypothetical protein
MLMRCAEALGPIEARANLQAVVVGMIAAGTLSEDSASARLDAWEAAANQGAKPVPVPVGTPAQIASAGFKVTKVVKRG